MNKDESVGSSETHEGEGAGRDEDEKGNTRLKKQVKEDTAEMTKDEGAGRGEMFEDKGAVRHKKNKDKTTTIHKVRTRDKEEANQIVNGCKRPIVKDKEGKKENNERSKTEPGRVARDRSKVQEPRDKRDEDNIQHGPEGDDQHKDGGSEQYDRTRLAKIAAGHATPTRDDYLLGDPRLAEAHDCSTVVPHTGADRSVQHNIPGTNLPQSQYQSEEGDGMYEGEGIGYDAGADHRADQHKEGGTSPSTRPSSPRSPQGTPPRPETTTS